MEELEGNVTIQRDIDSDVLGINGTSWFNYFMNMKMSL